MLQWQINPFLLGICMRLLSRLHARLDLRPNEGRPVLLLVTLSFSQGLALVMADTASTALFLSALGAAALPGVYLAAAVVVPLVGASIGWLGQRMPTERLAVSSFLALAVLMLLLWGGSTFGAWVFFLLLLWYRVFNAISGVIFWGLAGRLLNLRQAKRLYGVIGSGENVARVLGYAIIPLLVALVGVANLLALACVGMIGALASAIVLRRMASNIQVAQSAVNPERTRSAGGIKALRANPYILRILILIALSTWAFSTLDLTFAGQVQLHFSDTKMLANFLAGVSLLMSVLRLLGRPLLTGRLIGRYGVVLGLLTQPLALALGALLLFAGTIGGGPALIFWMVVAIRLSDSTINTILARPALQILFQPLPATQRLAVQSVADGVVAPLALGTVGLAGLFLRNTPLSVLALLLLGVGLIWAFVARRVGRSYLSALGQRLSRRIGLGSGADLTNPAALALVRQALDSAHTGDVLYAIDLLSQQLPAALEQARSTLLTHADPGVRRTMLGLISAGRVPADQSELAALLKIEPNLGTRAALIRAICAAAEAEAIDTVTPYIDDPAPEICRSALFGLLHHGGIAGILAGGQRLLHLAGSPAPEERILAATIVGDLGLVEFFQPLRGLFADPDPAVRRAVVLAAGQIRNTRLVGYQIAALADPSTAAAAARSLERTGPIALPALTAAFAAALPEKIRIATILGRIGGESAIVTLRGAVGHPDAALRSAACAGLAACGFHASGADRSLLRAQIRTEAMYAAWLLAASADLNGTPAELLTEAITLDIQRCCERILHLLAISSDAQAIATARTNLAQGTEDRRAYAIEIIDVLLPPDLKPAVLPLFDDIPAAQRLQRLRAIFPQPTLAPAERLRQLITDTRMPASTWARATALHSAAARNVALTLDPAELAATLVMVDRVIALRNVRLFATTPSEILAGMAERLTPLQLPPETPIFTQGEPGHTLFMLVAGAVRISSGGQTLNIMREGAVLGEMTVLVPAPRRISAETIVPTTLLCLDRSDLDAVFDERPELTRSLIQSLTRDLRSNVATLAALRAQRDQAIRSSDNTLAVR
jgi:HEAT repeat protein